MLGNSKNLPRGGKNVGTTRYRPNGMQASLPKQTPKQSFITNHGFSMYVGSLQELHELPEDEVELLDWETQRALAWFHQGQEYFLLHKEAMEENKALKAENQLLREQLEQLKSQQSSPPAPQSLKGTGYRDALTISPATSQKKKMANFSRRVRLYFILLDAFNRKLDDDEAEIEGCGSVLRKIFELVTNISADISENTLTIPDLDFKFYGSKSDFEAFAKKVSEWVSENGLNIPGTHFIIGKMYRFTARKPMSNDQIVEYEKFTLEVIDSSTKEIFMIDIMNMDGSTVFPCDFSVNSLAVSPKRGIYAKDPLHRKGKFNFLGVIRDIFSRTTTCMTKGPWKFEKPSLIFLVRQIKMLEAGYKMQGAPVLTTATCPVMCDDALCVSLTGCRCRNTKGDPIPVQISIYAAISIYQEKRCPNCRDVLKEFVCSAVESRQSMSEPKELPSKAEFELLVDRAEIMSQGYSFYGFDKYSEGSKDAMRILSDFSRKIEDAEKDAQMRAGGGGAAQAVERRMRAIAEAQARAIQIRAEAQAFEHRLRAIVAAPVPAPPMRAGGGAAAPFRRHQYDSDSDSDGGYGYIRRYGS